MKFSCRNKNCHYYGQEIELRAEQLVQINRFMAEETPFFYTISTVYCGYCGGAAYQGEWKESKPVTPDQDLPPCGCKSASECFEKKNPLLSPQRECKRK